MKKYKWIIWIVVLLLAGLGTWYWKFRPARVHTVLLTEHPAYGNLANLVTATGTVQPVDTVAVGTQVSGTIQKVFVDFNSQVRKGQLLAQLDKSILQAVVNQISANLAAARANAVYQASNYARQQHLFEVGAISQADWETARYQHQSSQEAVHSLEAQLSSARKSLSYADIYSPINGTVLSRSVSEGQTVAASLATPTLFSIARDLTHMQVQAAIDEADIGNVKTGQRVQFTVDAFPADTFAGTVKEIRLRSAVSANVVTYTTIIEAPNTSMKLKPGMTASITVYTSEVKQVLLVPLRATLFQPDSVLAAEFLLEQNRKAEKPPGAPDSVGKRKGQVAYVWLRQGDRLVHKRFLAGLSDDLHVQVLDGLVPDDLLVTGYQRTTASKATTAKSPFLPSRPRGTPGGGGRPGR